MNVHSGHLPRKAESIRKSAAAPSGADVENLKLLKISHHRDRAQAINFITRCKLQ